MFTEGRHRIKDGPIAVHSTYKMIHLDIWINL